MGSIDIKKCLDWMSVAKAVGPGWKSEAHVFARRVGPIIIRFSYRNSNSLMGRFGGGWNWKLGFQASKSTLLLSVLVAEVTISKYREKSL